MLPLMVKVPVKLPVFVDTKPCLGFSVQAGLGCRVQRLFMAVERLANPKPLNRNPKLYRAIYGVYGYVGLYT